MIWFGVVLGVVFAVVGALLMRTPAERILEWDQRTGKAIYKRAPNHEEGLRAAGKFYRGFGLFITAVGVVAAVVFAAIALSSAAR